MKILFIIILVCTSVIAYPQQQDTIVKGSLTIIQDTSITKLLNNESVLEMIKTVPGYRIQLTSSANRKEVYNLKTEFLNVYPNVRAYVTYQQPYFKLRVGDFTERTAANEFRDLIQAQFPGFIVPESVNLNTEKE